MRIVHVTQVFINTRLMSLLVLFSLLILLSFSKAAVGQTTRIVTFTTSGTWIVPADVTQITVEVWGAGGAGGGSTENKEGGSGGGGGGYSSGDFTVTPGQAISYTVGTGGIRSTGNGTAGGSSSVTMSSVTLIANGGGGGGSNKGSVGTGGTASGGTTNTSGKNGKRGNSSGGDGGDGANGGAGGDGVSDRNGNPGIAPGGGGGGGEAYWFFGTTSYAGGNGANGQVKITFTSSLPESFWYKADAGVSGTSSVTNWADQAGNNNNATNSGDVSLVTNSINFNPSLSFSDVDRQFPVSNTLTVQSFIIVSKIPATGNDLSGLSGADGDKGIRLSNSVNALGPNITPFQSWRGDNNTDDWVNTTNGGTGRINGVIDANMLHSSKWHIANLSRYQALTGDYYIGGYYSGRSYTGEIAEVMAFSGAVVNQNQVESYMAVKYGISLPGNYYASNGVTTWSTIPGFQNDIHGIGRDDNYGLNQLSSKSENPGTDILTIQSGNSFVTPTNAQTGTALNDKQFFITGHNGGAATSGSNLSAGINVLARKWYAQVTNGLPTESFQFDLSGAPLGTYCKIGVLIADDAALTTNQQFVEGTLSSATLTVNNLAITGNKYFTVATLTAPGEGAIATGQTICSGNAPATLTSTTDGTGFGNITYQWESSTDGTTWNTVSGAVGNTYSPGALVQTTWYRRKTIATMGTVSCTSAATSAITITVNPLPTATITSVNSTICNGTSTNITGTVTASGNWTLTLNNGSSAMGTNSGNFSIPVTPASSTTYTIASLTDANCAAVAAGLTGSTVVEVRAANVIDSPADTTFCETSSPADISITGTDMGTGVTYQWKICTDPYNLDNIYSYSDISGATAKDYNPGTVTQTSGYVRTTSGACTSNSNFVKLFVTPAVTDTIFASVPTENCGDINEWNISGTPGGGEYNTFTFQWQVSTDGITF